MLAPRSNLNRSRCISLPNSTAKQTSTGTNILCRKKYFSSTERLHIFQQVESQKRTKHNTGRQTSLPSTSTTGDSQRPSTSQGIAGRGRLLHRSQSTDLKPAAPQFDRNNTTEEQARWFLTLPDKIRKQYFSRKDQISLTVHCKRVIAQSSPELADDALRRCIFPGQEIDATHAEPRFSSLSSAKTDVSDGTKFFEIQSPEKHDCETLDAEMKYHSRPRMSESKDGICVSPSWPLPEPLPARNGPRRKSSQRTLTPLPLPPPTLAPVPPVPPMPAADQVSHFSRPRYTGPTVSTPESPAEAEHFQDTATRNKLRQHLSPQKFDEALEFGFAISSEESVRSSSASDDSFPLQAPPLYHGGQGDEDDRSLGPRTPSPVHNNDRTPIKLPSFDSGIGLPSQQSLAPPKAPMTRSPSGSIADSREMTIKMTLTRRDLRRGPEVELYSAQRQQNSGVEIENVDPLALDSLAVCDDPTGAHGAFAVQDSGRQKGVWSRLKGH